MRAQLIDFAGGHMGYAIQFGMVWRIHVLKILFVDHVHKQLLVSSNLLRSRRLPGGTAIFLSALRRIASLLLGRVLTGLTLMLNFVSINLAAYFLALLKQR
jgi:hypothetical protein